MYNLRHTAGGGVAGEVLMGKKKKKKRVKGLACQIKDAMKKGKVYGHFC